MALECQGENSMNRIKIILAICGVLLLGVLSWFYFTASVRAENQAARQELLNYLTQRLEDQQVPVNKIDVQGQDTFTISITLLSTGVDKTSPKDSS